MSPKKPAHKQTTEELMRRVFPKKVHEHLKKLAHSEKPKRSKASS
jgi:hypothetical protein